MFSIDLRAVLIKLHIKKDWNCINEKYSQQQYFHIYIHLMIAQLVLTNGPTSPTVLTGGSVAQTVLTGGFTAHMVLTGRSSERRLF